jgi:hypothetical protein
MIGELVLRRIASPTGGVQTKERVPTRLCALAHGHAIDREVEKTLHRIGQPTKRDGLSIPQVPATNESDWTLAS